MTSIVVTLPIRAESVANLREGWAARHKRAKAHRHTAWAMLRAEAPACAIDGRIAVTITRIAPRPLDSHDNLRTSTKAAVDGIADWLKLKDNDERIDWAYAQERGAPKHYAVRVEIRAAA
ncbi:hypothetical protein [Methylibium sp.]|uniref:hypothetical protein n=1 Tax=Methylibium sp. TaxID=2067992 RepID=UPI003D0F31AA